MDMKYMYPMFRLLRAEEIECRIGTVSKEGKGVSLLLYKDARCDMRVLDETVGPMNWTKEYNRDNANCTISIWDSEKGQWISKEDTGTESNTEAEKGLASDSFKRAAVVWGIGRELYTAPFIWIPGGNPKGKYRVTEIGYDGDRKINRLIIADQKGTVVYSMGKMNARKEEPKREDPIDLLRKLAKLAQDLGVDVEYFKVLCKKKELSEITEAMYQNIAEHPQQVKEGYALWKQSAS